MQNISAPSAIEVMELMLNFKVIKNQSLNKSNAMKVGKKSAIRLFLKDTKQLYMELNPKMTFNVNIVQCFLVIVQHQKNTLHLNIFNPTSKVIWLNMRILQLKLNKIMQEIRFLKKYVAITVKNCFTSNILLVLLQYHVQHNINFLKTIIKSNLIFPI